MRVAVLTVSDRGANRQRADESGPAVERLAGAQGWEIVARLLVPDDQACIEAALRSWCDAGMADIVLTTGGTGLAARDVTPEATRAVVEREVPGIPEMMRSVGRLTTPLAALSRQVAGQRGLTLIVNLPGSPAAATECLGAVAGILDHAVAVIAGHGDRAHDEHRSHSPDADDHAVGGEPVLITGIETAALDADGLVARIRRPECGGLSVFEGTVRSPNDGEDVERLEYEAHEELANVQLAALARQTVARFEVGGVVAVHRVGPVGVGEPAVVVATVASHRAEAFAATRFLIDAVKTDVAIWKKEVLTDGSAAWAGLPAVAVPVQGPSRSVP